MSDLPDPTAAGPEGGLETSGNREIAPPSMTEEEAEPILNGMENAGMERNVARVRLGLDPIFTAESDPRPWSHYPSEDALRAVPPPPIQTIREPGSDLLRETLALLALHWDQGYEEAPDIDLIAEAIVTAIESGGLRLPPTSPTEAPQAEDDPPSSCDVCGVLVGDYDLHMSKAHPDEHSTTVLLEEGLLDDRLFHEEWNEDDEGTI